VEPVLGRSRPFLISMTDRPPVRSSHIGVRIEPVTE
jgi:hypothetical protein